MSKLGKLRNMNLIIYKNLRRDAGTGTGSASGTLIGLVTGIVPKIPSLADLLTRFMRGSDTLLVEITESEKVQSLIW